MSNNNNNTTPVRIFITEIGLKLLESDIEPALWRGVIIADFQELGMMEVRSEILKMCGGVART